MTIRLKTQEADDRGAGYLQYRIVIERYTETKSVFGEEEKTWSTYKTVWAGKQDVSSYETFRANELGAKLTTRFLIRYSSDVSTVNPKDRILYNSDYYEIVGVQMVEKNKWILIDTAIRQDQ